MNKYSFAKSTSFLLIFSVVVAFGSFLADTPAEGQAAWSQLFKQGCSDTGGCNNDCLNSPGTCPNNCVQGCFHCGSTCQSCPAECKPNCPANEPCPLNCPSLYNSTTCDQCDPVCKCNQATGWFTATTGSSPSIAISAAKQGVAYCQTVTTEDTCVFSVGTGGITQVSFNFAVSESCTPTGPNPLPQGTSGTEWLAFWMVNGSTIPTAEVDFIESRFGPSGGLNTNFDGHGTQVPIFSNPAPWNGSITATFSSNTSDCPGAVQASVQSFTNGKAIVTGASCLSESTGYFFVMDTAGGSQNPKCTIQVTNLAVQGSVPNSGTNCVGLPVTSN